MSTPTPTDVKSSQPVNLTFLEERYSDISSLGQGGMGQVFKAYDSSLLKWVAIKVLAGKGDNHELVLRFQNEAKAASKLKHPNIVTVMDFGKSPEDELYLVMELVEGASLSDYLEEKGKLDIGETLKLAISISDGLAHAHSQEIVHRDLKPSNIVISSSGVPKIVDFGIAKLPAEEDDQELTKTGVIMGSPLYMSPEQATGDFVDHRSDLYSVGCILFRMLTGVPPFDRDNPMETMFAHMGDRAPKLSEASGIDFPEELEQVVATLLSKNKHERFSSANDLKFKLIDLELSLEASKKPSTEDLQTEEEKKEEEKKSASFILNDDDLLVDPENKGMPKEQVIALAVLATIASIALIWGSIQVLDNYLNEPEKIGKKDVDHLNIQDLVVNTHISRNTCTIRRMNESELKAYRKQFKRGDIKSFSFANCNDMGDGLKYYTDLQIEVLSIKNCDITDSGMRFIRNMKNLNYVSLEGNKKMSSKGLANLLYLPKLRDLALEDMDARSIDLHLLGKLNKIQFLKLTNTSHMSPEFWQTLAKWPRLRVLRLGGFDVNEFDFAQVKQLPHLRKLYLKPVTGLTSEKEKELNTYLAPCKIAENQRYKFFDEKQ